MNLIKVEFSTMVEEIKLRSLIGGIWHVQVMKGFAGTHHVETEEFPSYAEAFNYVNVKYKLGI